MFLISTTLIIISPRTQSYNFSLTKNTISLTSQTISSSHYPAPAPPSSPSPQKKKKKKPKKLTRSSLPLLRLALIRKHALAIIRLAAPPDKAALDPIPIVRAFVVQHLRLGIDLRALAFRRADADAFEAGRRAVAVDGGVGNWCQ